MAKLSIQQIRGLKDLIQEAIEAGVNATEEVHQAIARQPFALLEKIDPIAVPVHAIEHIQQAVTSGIYQTIRIANRTAGTLATLALDRLEEQGGIHKTQ